MAELLSLPNLSFQQTDFAEQARRFGRIGRQTRTLSGTEDPRLKETCAELESLFINHLLNEMRATVPKEALLQGGKAEEILTSLFDNQLARELALNRGIGLARLLHEGFSRAREGGGGTVENASPAADGEKVLKMKEIVADK
jgi:Rod binding domain-containing protein